MTKQSVDRRGGWWLPYVGLVVLLGGWLIQYGMERQKHTLLEDEVAGLKKVLLHLEEQQRVTNVVNYSEHPKWTLNILAAEEAK